MNLLPQKNLLIINFSKSIGLELAYSFAHKNANLLLNGKYDLDKRSDLVKSISKLGVRCLHHSADILDNTELDLLMKDIRVHLDLIDIVIILVSLKNYKSLFPIFDKTLEILNQKSQGKLVNLFCVENSEMNNKKDIDEYCNNKIKSFKNLKYSSIELKNIIDVDNLALSILTEN
jgi:short-subunit dehydrogenase